MEKVRKETKRIPAKKTSLVSKLRVNIILFILAVVLIGSGFYLSYRLGGVEKDEISIYNEGVSVYNSSEYILESEDFPASYPIQNLLTAAAYFQQAASETTDNSIKSLALYNLGTLIGRDYLVFLDERIASLGVAEAIDMLVEVVRIDPNNEDAKYNLEFLEMVEPLQTESDILMTYFGGAMKPQGAIDKGY